MKKNPYIYISLKFNYEKKQKKKKKHRSSITKSHNFFLYCSLKRLRSLLSYF